MLTEKYYGNYFVDDISDGSGIIIPEAPDEPSEPETYEPGTVVIEEQTVTTELIADDRPPYAVVASALVTRFSNDKLLINFDGKDYLMPRVGDGRLVFYGEFMTDENDNISPKSFSNFPFLLGIESAMNWILITPEPGTYTISAKIPDGKGAPKIIKMETPKTIVNQVESIIESLGGTVDKKHRNLQNLLSTLADMAENGEIGRGGITPTGTLEITENGQYDVTEYASAEVDVAGSANEMIPITLVLPSNSLGGSRMWYFDENGKYKSTDNPSGTKTVYVPKAESYYKISGIIVWLYAINDQFSLTFSANGLNSTLITSADKTMMFVVVKASSSSGTITISAQST